MINLKMGMDEDIRFGIKEPRKLNSDVKVYKIPFEEHMKYWDKTTVMLNEVRRLARETSLTNKEIASVTGADLKKVQQICHYERNVKRKTKNKKGLN